MGEKWHGGVHTTIKAPIDKAWAIAGNFCALDKWLKTVKDCRKVEGEYNQPGCVRAVSGSSFPNPDGSDNWAKEKILTYDAETYSFSYSMIDGTFGLQGYVNEFQLKDLGEGLIQVNWTYEVDPLEGRTEEAQANFMNSVFNKSISILEEVANADAQAS